MLNNKFLMMFLKIMRLLLPCGTLVLGFLNDGYKLKIVDGDMIYLEYTNYFDGRIVESGDFGPLACMLLCIVTIVCAIVCMFKETERTLTTLASVSSFAMIGGLVTLVVNNLGLTWIGWIMVGLLAGCLAISAVQEMKLEDANRKV